MEDVGPALGVEAGVEDGFEHCCRVVALFGLEGLSFCYFRGVLLRPGRWPRVRRTVTSLRGDRSVGAL